MKAIILAAGIGYRLYPITNEVPKCLVKVAGKPILQRAIDSLINNGILDIVIVVGYKKKLIKKFIADTYNNIGKFHFIDNDIYDKTNNVYSLWLAKDHFDDDIILIESDIAFENKIVENLIKCKDKNVIVVDKYNPNIDGTIVITDESMNIEQLMTKNHQSYLKDNLVKAHKTVNIYKFSKEFLTKYFYPNLKTYIETQSYSKYYELILGIIIYLRSPELKAISASGLKWYEIDDYSDLIRANYIFAPVKKKMKILEESYGGFWNYTDYIDFMYMRNIDFPPSHMIDDLKNKFEDLTHSFCSSQDIINLKVSIIDFLKKEYTFLFNGSSQALKFILPLLGKFLIPVPTFEEYINAAENNTCEKYILSLDNFQISLNSFAQYAIEKKVESLVIVNPNNPTSTFISHHDIVEFLVRYSDKFRYIVIDESFIDFVDFNESVKDQIEKYNNLVIIKSLGKTYGIPGLRLGYIYTSNKLIKEKYKNFIPIWNINSIAEYFLELFLKYRKEYVASLSETRKRKNDFIDKLNQISYLKVFNAFGNFIMVEIKKGFPLNATKLKEYLFEKYSILVKDLLPKFKKIYTNYDGGGFLRFAVLSKSDNDNLADCLKKIGDELHF